MRIGIDARKLHDFGIGTYVQNLLRQLVRVDTGAEYVVFCRGADRDWIASLGRNVRPVVERAAPYSVFEQLTLPVRLAGQRLDVFHSPHYVLPPFVTCPSVVTIHDCIHLMFPQYLPNRLAYAYSRMFMWVAAHRSAHVLTVSEASKRDILRFFRIPEEKVTVIYNAIDERFRIPPPDEAAYRIRERFQLHEPFVLYAGNVKPHKNLERLIEALSRLHANGFPELKLLIIGNDISKYAMLRRAVHHHNLHKYVRFLGFVPDQTLAILYRLASVFVFPSLYEGFGLPPLEAMASGTPVVTSNLSSLPEVVGPAAILVDPYDSMSIAEGIARVLCDRHLRENLRRRGLERAEHFFSWEHAAQRVHDIYERVARRGAA
jgi:glycosyltransferase involved in cell wall biosynthesis